jgi:NTE family protein
MNSTIDNQVRSLRKRQVVSAFVNPNDEHSGTYWGMWTKPSEYPAASLPIDNARALELAKTPTRLAEMPNELQNRLINFGYGMAHRAVRSYFDQGAFTPNAFPCPEACSRRIRWQPAKPAVAKPAVAVPSPSRFR